MTAMFVSLPITDLDRAKAFYLALGFTINPLFTDHNAACVVVEEDHSAIMILTREFFQTFTDLPLGDPKVSPSSAVAIFVDSREAVDPFRAHARNPAPRTPLRSANSVKERPRWRSASGNRREHALHLPAAFDHAHRSTEPTDFVTSRIPRARPLPLQDLMIRNGFAGFPALPTATTRVRIGTPPAPTRLSWRADALLAVPSGDHALRVVVYGMRASCPSHSERCA